MTAILVRIARAMGLHHEALPRSVFETELRRRLWHNIRWIDLFSAWDRGSADLLIGLSTFSTPRPQDIADSELNVHSTTLPSETPGVTSMTWSTISLSAIRHTLHYASPESPPGGGDTWADRLTVAQGFETKVHEQYLAHIDPSDPFHRLLAGAFQAMIAAHKLRAARPLRKHPLSTSPRIDTPYILQLASDALHAAELPYADPALAQFRWLAWVPWHPLATALAGLCTIRDTQVAEEAGGTVEKAYIRQGRLVADSQRGMLWRPIERLYRKARAFREGREDAASPASRFRSANEGSTADRSPAQVGVDHPPASLGLSVQDQHQQSTSAGMPSSSALDGAMDFPFGGGDVAGDGDFNDSSMDWWMDFQNIYEDMSMAAPDFDMATFS